MYNPFKDGKFWTAFMDGVISLALYFVGKYGGESMLADMKMVIGFIQPMALILIGGFLTSDIVALRSGRLLKFIK